jgi:hypothetical protein
LPPPMVPGNEGTASDTCYMGDRFRAMAQLPAEGWRYYADSGDKFGWISETVGAKLTIEVDSRASKDAQGETHPANSKSNDKVRPC